MAQVLLVLEIAESRDSDKWTAEQRELSEADESVPMIVVSDILTGSARNVHTIRRSSLGCVPGQTRLADLLLS